MSSSKTFDLKVIQRSGPQHVFQSLNREEHSALSKHFAARKVRVKNEMDEVETLKDVLSDDDDEEMDEEEEETSKARPSSKKKEADADAMDEDEDSEGEKARAKGLPIACPYSLLFRPAQRTKTLRQALPTTAVPRRHQVTREAPRRAAMTWTKSVPRRRRKSPTTEPAVRCHFLANHRSALVVLPMPDHEERSPKT